MARTACTATKPAGRQVVSLSCWDTLPGAFTGGTGSTGELHCAILKEFGIQDKLKTKIHLVKISIIQIKRKKRINHISFKTLVIL